MLVERCCEHCGHSFAYKKSGPGRLRHFCSSECSAAAKACRIKPSFCSDCGAELRGHGGSTRCRACAMRNRKVGRPRVPRSKKPCEGCGAEVEYLPSRVRKFCSNECRKKSAYEIKPCGFCGAEFRERRSRGRKFCSTACQHASLRRDGTLCECAFCGVEYRNKRRNGEGNKFCSRECAFAWKKSPEGRAQAREATLRHLGTSGLSLSYKEHLKRGYRLKPCEACGKPHNGMGATCSQECRTVRFLQYQWETQTKGKVNTCLVCGAQWCGLLGGGGYRSYCSDECRREGRRDAKRWAKRKRRLREAAADADRISRRAVFERDGWRCQACGCDTPEELMGTCDDDAPELDHIVPLAKGGAHTYGNVQLLCRTCNGLKSDMDWDEFLAQYFNTSRINDLRGAGSVFSRALGTPAGGGTRAGLTV